MPPTGTKHRSKPRICSGRRADSPPCKVARTAAIKAQDTRERKTSNPGDGADAAHEVGTNLIIPRKYIEPHVEFDASELSRLGPVDAVISPLSGMGLPSFELVHGPQATIELVKTLQAQCILPMSNGEVDTTGAVSAWVTPIGKPADFKARLKKERIQSKILEVTPGEPLLLNVPAL